MKIVGIRQGRQLLEFKIDKWDLPEPLVVDDIFTFSSAKDPQFIVHNIARNHIHFRIFSDMEYNESYISNYLKCADTSSIAKVASVFREGMSMY